MNEKGEERRLSKFPAKVLLMMGLQPQTIGLHGKINFTGIWDCYNFKNLKEKQVCNFISFG
jgi:hypothetical protein